MDSLKFCSIDLEFTGFNTEIDQILEIGFVVFELSQNGIVEKEKWSQLFSPNRDVHKKILGLTGISQSDLDDAPKFSDEHREFLQEKLGDAILVAHNPTLDIKFLENYGIKLSGRSIDTLDLAQIFLPTHHSYNLENLINHFGIEVGASHRALDDAIATIKLLHKLLQIFYGLTNELKKQLLATAKLGQLEWSNLLELEIVEPLQQVFPTKAEKPEQAFEDLNLVQNCILEFGIQENLNRKILNTLHNKDERSILVVEKSTEVTKLWELGLGQAIFKPQDLFSETNFRSFFSQIQSPEECRFAMKVLVWLETNWQTETILDLNLSFFGGQFRSFVNNGEQKPLDGKVLIATFADLSEYSKTKGLEGRLAYVMSMASLEQFYSSGNSKKLSWNKSLYILRSIYNPDSDFGLVEIKQEVLEALAATDLFFSLLYMLLSKNYLGQRFVKTDDIISNPYIHRKLSAMVATYRAKLAIVLEKTKLPLLQQLMEQLETFLVEEPETIKWIEVSEFNTTFKNQPLTISKKVQSDYAHFTSVTFIERFTEPNWVNYLNNRLGFTVQIEKSENFLAFPCKAVFSETKAGLETEISLETNDLPAIVLFEEPKQVKSFYDERYDRLIEYSHVLAQGYSGGMNKLFNNFVINQNSILLVTTNMLLKSSTPVKPKSCYFEDLPKYDQHHPYNLAIIQNSEIPNEDLVKTLELGQVIQAINLVSSMNLEKLSIKIKPSNQHLVQTLETIY